MMKIRNIIKSEIVVVILEDNRGAAHVMFSEKCKIPKEIPVVFHDGSRYDYRFIIKELAKEFKGQFECLGENKENCTTFSIPIVKKLGDGNSIQPHHLILLIAYQMVCMILNLRIVTHTLIT